MNTNLDVLVIISAHQCSVPPPRVSPGRTTSPTRAPGTTWCSDSELRVMIWVACRPAARGESMPPQKPVCANHDTGRGGGRGRPGCATRLGRARRRTELSKNTTRIRTLFVVTIRTYSRYSFLWSLLMENTKSSTELKKQVLRGPQRAGPFFVLPRASSLDITVFGRKRQFPTPLLIVRSNHKHCGKNTPPMKTRHPSSWSGRIFANTLASGVWPAWQPSAWSATVWSEFDGIFFPRALRRRRAVVSTDQSS